MNQGTYMVCAVVLWFFMYMFQIKGTSSTSKTAASNEVRAQEGGRGGSNNATKPGGWFSSFSNFGAAEFLASSFLFSLSLGLPMDWLAPVFSLFGGQAAAADLMARLLLWVFVSVLIQEPLKTWLSIEVEEAVIGPLATLAVYLMYNANTPGITWLVNFAARAFGVGV